MTTPQIDFEADSSGSGNDSGTVNRDTTDSNNPKEPEPANVSGSAKREPVEVLAEEFAARLRRGESPSPDEYVERAPEHADEIRELFPLLAAMEKVDPLSRSSLQNNDQISFGECIDDYQLLREIGRGGMGIVYEAEQLSLQRRVAIKLLAARVIDSPRSLERFQREAQVAAGMSHPNIVPVFEVGHEGDQWFYTMQLIHGRSLDQIFAELRTVHQDDWPADALPSAALDVAEQEVAEQEAAHPDLKPKAGTGSGTADLWPSPISAVEYHQNGRSLSNSSLSGSLSNDSVNGRREFFRIVARIGTHAAEGLHYAHMNGVVHRDVKPGNIMLGNDGHVWLADFGLAWTDGQNLTQTGSLVGTLRYMAPEQLRGWADPRSDVYSLGATLYEALAFRPVFESNDHIELMRQLAHDTPAKLRSIERRIPRDLETIIHTAIEKEPERRYVSAEALAEDLRRFVEDRPILARRSGRVERAWLWCRRNPLVATLSLAVALAVTLVAVVSTIGYRETSKALAAVEQEQKNVRHERNLAQIAQKDAETASVQARAAADEANRFRELSDANAAAARKQSKLAVQSEAEARKREAEARKLARDNFKETIRQLVESGVAALDDGQVGRAATTFLSALELDGPDSEQATAHRMRVQFALSQHPALVSLSRIDIRRGSGKLGRLEFSPDEARLLIRTWIQEPVLVLWDRSEGRFIGEPLRLRRVSQTEFSSDGSLLLTNSQSGGVQLWEASTARLIRTLTTDETLFAGFNPVGNRVVTSHWSQELRLWDVETGDLVHDTVRIPGGPIFKVEFTPDGERGFVFRGSNDGKGLLQIWSLKEAKPLSEPVTSDVREWRISAVSGDGTKVAIAGEDQLEIYSGDTGRSLHGPLRTPWRETIFMSFNTEGSRFCAAGGSRIVVRDVVSGREMLTLNEMASLAKVHCDWQSRRLITSDTLGQVRIRSLDTGQLIHPVIQHESTVLGIHLPGDSRLVTTTSAGLRREWRLESAESKRVLEPHRYRIRSAALNPSRTRVVTSRFYGDTRVWHWATGEPVSPSLELKSDSAVLSPNGKLVGTASDWGISGIHDAVTGRLISPVYKHDGYMSGFTFTQDSQHFVTGDTTGKLRVFQVGTGELVRTFETGKPILGVRCLPQSQALATGSDTAGRLQAYDLLDGRDVFNDAPQNQSTASMKFSRDESQVVLTLRGAPNVYSTVTGELKLQVNSEFGLSVSAFSPDTRRLAVADSEGLIRILDIETGRQVLPSMHQSGAAVDLAFSDNGRWLLCGTTQSMRLWDARDGAAVSPLVRFDSSLVRADFGPQGNQFVGLDDLGVFRSLPIPTDVDTVPLEELRSRITLLTCLKRDRESGFVRERPDAVLSAWARQQARRPARP